MNYFLFGAPSNELPKLAGTERFRHQDLALNGTLLSRKADHFRLHEPFEIFVIHFNDFGMGARIKRNFRAVRERFGNKHIHAI
jgi:hypothetical protein